jgi:ATP-dependent exoDNAse (exonuclease V) beta subunit
LLAKTAYLRKSDKAKDIGSIVHEMIHYHIRNEAYPVQQELVKSEDKEKIDASFNSYLEFEKAHEVVWLLTEEIIFCRTHYYAGCVDGLALVDGILTIVDFKTSGQISDEYFLQLSAYQQALTEQMGIIPEQRLIIRVPKDGGEVEAVLVPTDYKFDVEVFNHLREVHK